MKTITISYTSVQEAIQKLEEERKKLLSENWVVFWNNGELNADEYEEEVFVAETYAEAEKFILSEIEKNVEENVEYERTYFSWYKSSPKWAKVRTWKNGERHEEGYYYIQKGINI